MSNRDAQPNSVKNRALSGFFWRFFERCGAQSVTLIVSIVLARLLDPAVYGTIALITVFTNILDVFVNGGFGNALIQKKDADDLDFSSVFYFNIAVCLALYGLLFLSAPLIARFYALPELTALVRVLGLTLVISGVKNVQQAYVSRNMLFKRFFFSTLGGTLGAAVIGIWMACRGYGVWALVVQQLFNAATDTCILWLTVKWRPKRMFSFRRLKRLFSYGWKLLVSGLLDTVYNNLRQLIIGKLYTKEDLAFYNKGSTYTSPIIMNVNNSIDSVLFPVMSDAQDDPETVRAMTRRAIRVSSYIIWPLMMGIASCAEPLVRILLTDKWLPCVPYMRIFCIVYAFWPIHTANLNAIKAMGRSDIFLRLELIKKAVGLTVLAVTMWFGVMAMAYSLLLTSVSSQLINSWPNRKLLQYTYGQQILDFLPSMLLAFAMFGVVWSVQLLGLGSAVTLLIQIPLGVVFYAGMSKLLRFESFDYVLHTAKGFLKRG